ncbi:tyrosine-type recombinase/integrase [Bacillus sp. S13(2024)]|uniref:tyrosine-type recombinase/integrase n=1 Tax=unclassified Bacillus (in: firmicutes) TaxID=185979 RepID=UPI003D2261D8
MKKKRSRYLNDEELELVGEAKHDYVGSWDQAISSFMKDCELRGLREATLFYYEKEMRMIFRYLEEQELIDLPPYKFTKTNVEDNIILYMKNIKKLSAATINIRLRAFRTVVKWLYEKEMIPNYPMKNVKLLKDRTKEIITFTPQQLTRFFNAIDKTTWTGVRNYAICIVLLECGLRQNELLNLEVTDVLWEENTILVKHTKTYRMRKVPITEETKAAIKRWLNIRGESYTNQLFCNIAGEPLTQRGIYQMIARYGKEAKIENVRVSPHTFRHTCAKLYLKNGGDLFSLQHILGHTDIAMTRRYVQFMYDDVAALHKQFTPLKSIKL